MEPVGFATLNFTPRPITGLGNVAPLWLGDAITHGGEVARLYMKQASRLQMLSECLCAVIGSELSLPIPKAYLVADPNAYLGGGVLIGSEDAGTPSLKHYIEINDPVVAQMLARWQSLPRAALFDEWTLNWDRNQGNLLWDGATQWALIDHAAALGAMPEGEGHPSPPDAPVPVPSARAGNQLARFISAQHGDLGFARLRKQLPGFRDECQLLDTDELLEGSRCQALDALARAQHALCCLQDRLPHLPGLIARHGPPPAAPHPALDL